MSNDLHQMLSDLYLIAGRTDERTELMLKSMDEFKRSADSHDTRIASLESDRTKAKGVILGISLGSGTIGALLAKIFPFTGH